jgi:hypothetical protein
MMLGLVTLIVLVVLAGWVLYSLNKLTLEQDMIIARLEALEAARAPGVPPVASMREPLAEPRTEPRGGPR